MIKFNGAMLRPSIPRPLPLQNVPSQSVKFVDDGTVAVAVNLRSQLRIDPQSRPHPRTFHERTGHFLPSELNLLQHQITDTEKFVSDNNMVINKKKTGLMKFSFSRTLDFPPEVYFEDGSMVQTMCQTTLLGVIVSDNLKWQKNTEFICLKARRKLWVIRRMMQLDLNVSQLFDVYIKEVRSVLEYAVPVWHSSLTKKEKSEIESVQKIAFRMILKHSYTSYSSACAFFGTLTLEQRRREICLKFALKNIKINQSQFEPAPIHEKLRKRNQLVKEYKCNSNRFQRSSLPYLAKLANESQKSK